MAKAYNTRQTTTALADESTTVAEDKKPAAKKATGKSSAYAPATSLQSQFGPKAYRPPAPPSMLDPVGELPVWGSIGGTGVNFEPLSYDRMQRREMATARAKLAQDGQQFQIATARQQAQDDIRNELSKTQLRLEEARLKAEQEESARAGDLAEKAETRRAAEEKRAADREAEDAKYREAEEARAIAREDRAGRAEERSISDSTRVGNESRAQTDGSAAGVRAYSAAVSGKSGPSRNEAIEAARADVANFYKDRPELIPVAEAAAIDRVNELFDGLQKDSARAAQVEDQVRRAQEEERNRLLDEKNFTGSLIDSDTGIENSSGIEAAQNTPDAPSSAVYAGKVIDQFGGDVEKATTVLREQYYGAPASWLADMKDSSERALKALEIETKDALGFLELEIDEVTNRLPAGDKSREKRRSDIATKRIAIEERAKRLNASYSAIIQASTDNLNRRVSELSVEAHRQSEEYGDGLRRRLLGGE